MPTILLVGVKLAGETMWSREVCHPRPWPRTRRGTQKTESRDAVVPPLLVRYLGTGNLRADPVHNTVCQYRKLGESVQANQNETVFTKGYWSARGRISFGNGTVAELAEVTSGAYPGSPSGSRSLIIHCLI